MAKMTKAKAASAPTPIETSRLQGETVRQAIARTYTGPSLRHGIVAAQMFGGIGHGLDEADKPGIVEYAGEIKARSDRLGTGDLALASELLASQAITLDAMFAELASRAARNMGQYLDASERYARMALKAQANSRAALEALAKLHQPREQTVRHVHVNEGGQAVIADQFHHHAGGRENGKSDEQSDATGAAGTSTALPCPDAEGNGMPISGSERQAAMQDARRDESRRA